MEFSTENVIADNITQSNNETSFLRVATFNTFINTFHFDISIRIVSCIIACIGILLNGILLHLIRKYRQFHKPYMHIRLVYVILDFMFALTIILQLISEIFKAGQAIHCLFSNMLAGLYLMSIQLTAYVAVERYCYFCRPMSYSRIFTQKSITVATIVIFICCGGYPIAMDILIGRRKQEHVTVCQLKNQRYSSIIQILLFFIPAIVCTILSIVKIKKLIGKLENAPIVMPPVGAMQSATFGPNVRRKAGQNALR